MQLLVPCRPYSLWRWASKEVVSYSGERCAGRMRSARLGIIPVLLQDAWIGPTPPAIVHAPADFQTGSGQRAKQRDDHIQASALLGPAMPEVAIPTQAADRAAPPRPQTSETTTRLDKVKDWAEEFAAIASKVDESLATLWRRSKRAGVTLRTIVCAPFFCLVVPLDSDGAGRRR